MSRVLDGLKIQSEWRLGKGKYVSLDLAPAVAFRRMVAIAAEDGPTSLDCMGAPLLAGFCLVSCAVCYCGMHIVSAIFVMRGLPMRCEKDEGDRPNQAMECLRASTAAATKDSRDEMLWHGRRHPGRCHRELDGGGVERRGGAAHRLGVRRRGGAAAGPRLGSGQRHGGRAARRRPCPRLRGAPRGSLPPPTSLSFLKPQHAMT